MTIWKRITHFFEHGDLTPFAVFVSVMHYAPVLMAHGESMVAAWFIGILVDMLHFRTVRRAVSVRSWFDAFVAILTTAMATAYHWRYYDGDWLLALPIPVGIAILAYHASQTDSDTAAADTLRQERDTAILERDNALIVADRTRQSFDVIAAELDTARLAVATRNDEIATERAKVATLSATVDKLERSLAKSTEQRDTTQAIIDSLPPILREYVTAVANGVTPNGDFSDKFGIGKTTLDRANSILLKETTS